MSRIQYVKQGIVVGNLTGGTIAVTDHGVSVSGDKPRRRPARPIHNCLLCGSSDDGTVTLKLSKKPCERCLEIAARTGSAITMEDAAGPFTVEHNGTVVFQLNVSGCLRIRVGKCKSLCFEDTMPTDDVRVKRQRE